MTTTVMTTTETSNVSTTTAVVDNDTLLAQELIRQATKQWQEKEVEAINGNGSSILLSKAEGIWAILHQTILTPDIPFHIHQLCYNTVYNNRSYDDDLGTTMTPTHQNGSNGNVQQQREIKPCWFPPSNQTKANIETMMALQGFQSYEEFYIWSITNRNDFWMESMKAVHIEWSVSPTSAFSTTTTSNSDDSSCCDDGAAVTVDPFYAPIYFPNGELNIADSCFRKINNTDVIDKDAILFANDCDPTLIQSWTYSKLHALSVTVAYQIQHVLQLPKGTNIAICMPMIPESIAIYLGIVYCGCVVVSIADSFSAIEIATRCRIANVQAIFTQDVIYRNTQPIPLVTRIWEATTKLVVTTPESSLEKDDSERKESKFDLDDNNTNMKVVILPASLHAGSYDDDNTDRVALHESICDQLRPGFDYRWQDFITIQEQDTNVVVYMQSVKCTSMDPCNILFSSGTTGEPKAVVWSHSTPIKCCIDGYYHQNITSSDHIAWPTNIGWMMGPWVLFQLIHGATLCLYQGLPHTKEFCKFIEVSKVTMLGVIPSLVKAWYERNSIRDCDWSRIRRFSSTGEASDAETYHWLMSRVPGYAPVIEYCGGTEIGGSFLSSTMVQPNVPSMFSTPVLGSKISLLDPDSKCFLSAGEYISCHSGITTGELVIQPPSIGLSTVLLNRNHFNCYYNDMPKDESGRFFRRHGDAMEAVRDDNMSLPYYRALGRCDDTMNLGGIKISSIEIERVCNHVSIVKETAAIAVTSSGPCKLVIYAVLNHCNDDESVQLQCTSVDLKAILQKSIKHSLNPLFGIHDVVITDSLPRTASNKIMRRLLRDNYLAT